MNLKVVGASKDTEGDIGFAGAVMFMVIVGVFGFVVHALPWTHAALIFPPNNVASDPSVGSGWPNDAAN